jgi:predicted metal-binding protein
MSQLTLMVCELCRFPSGEKEREGLRGGQHFLNNINASLNQDSEGMKDLKIEPVRCIAACDRACVAAFASPGKQTYIFRDLCPTDGIEDLLTFASQYAVAELGKVPYADRPEGLKRSLMAVLPVVSP